MIEDEVIAIVTDYESLMAGFVTRRKLLALSQEVAGELCGLTAGYLNKLEISHTNPNAANARALGRDSLPKLLRGMGLVLVMVPEAAARKAKKFRIGRKELAVTDRTFFTERSRHAAKQRWERMTATQRQRHMRKMGLASAQKRRLRRKMRSVKNG